MIYSLAFALHHRLIEDFPQKIYNLTVYTRSLGWSEVLAWASALSPHWWAPPTGGTGPDARPLLHPAVGGPGIYRHTVRIGLADLVSDIEPFSS